MNHMSISLKNEILNEKLQNAHIALYNGDVEINKASYKRQPCAFVPATEGQTSNSADVLFSISTEDWGPITHIGIFNTLTGGEWRWKSKAEFMKDIGISGQYKIPKNYLIVRLR